MKKKKIFNRPALHSDSADNDVAAIGLVNSILASNGGVASGLNHHDSWPNTDGPLELKTVSGEPDGLLTAQVKPARVGKNVISHTFEDDKFLCYCKEERGLPVIFIGVDLKSKKAYWREMSPSYVGSLKTLTIHLPKSNVIDYGNTSYLAPWKTICDRRKNALIASGRGFDSAVTDEISQQSSAIAQLYKAPGESGLLKKNIDAVNSIVENIKEKILLYEGHLFLVSPTYINNKEVRDVIRKNLDITVPQEELFIDELIAKGILSKTGDVVLFAEDALGQEKISYLIKNDLIKIEKIYESFTEAKVRKAILKKIVGIPDAEQVDKFLHFLSSDFSNALGDMKRNDDIVTNLDLLKEYSFRTPKKAVQIVKEIINLPPLPVTIYKDKIFGKFPGASHDKVLTEAIDVLDNIRYLEIGSVFSIAVELSLHPNKDVSKKGVELVKHIAEYNLFALRKIRYYPQLEVLKSLKLWSFEKKRKYLSVLLEVGKEILNSEFEGSQMTDWKTFTLSFGPLAASDELESIRNDYFSLIKSFFIRIKDSAIKKKLLDTLEVGSRTPNRGKYSDELEKMILDYVNSLIKFYLEIVPDENLTNLHEIEEQLHWFIRRFTKERVEYLALQQKLENNRVYQIFRVFYGYDLNFDIDTPWREAKEQREKIIGDFVKEISAKNIPFWIQDIKTIASNYSDENYDKFQYFNYFLQQFAKDKPELAMQLINETELKPFLSQLIFGLWLSESHDVIRTILIEWAKSSRELSTIAGLFWYTKSIDEELIEETFKSSKKTKDIFALTTIVRSIVFSYGGEGFAKSLFINTIKELTTLENVRWVYNFYPHDSHLIESLNTQETDALLDNLLLVEEVNHDVEEILIQVSKSFPEKIVSYFEKRISRKIKNQSNNRYNAVPFSLYELPKAVLDNAEVLIGGIFEWFANKEPVYRYYGSQLLKELFPNMDIPLSNKLLELIKKGGEKNADIVINVMRAYEGQSFLYPIAKAFIKKFLRSEKRKNYKEYMGELFIALSATGVVSGEYGLPEAYKQKKESVQAWKSDKSKLIQKFVKEYEDYLNKNIAYHTKRADEDIELMKRGSI